MDIDVQTLEVKNNPAANRFEVQLADQLGVVEYQKEGGAYIFTHTGVPREYGGRGIADKLVKNALETAKAEGAGVVPLCPFVKTYIKRHPEYEPLVIDIP